MSDCLRVNRFRRTLLPVRGTLAGGILLFLALGMSGLFFSPPAASARSASAGMEPAVTSPFKGRPTHTPTPTPTAQPTPTSIVIPSPTAPPTQTALATVTADQGTKREGAPGAGKGQAQSASSASNLLLGWGLGALVGLGAVFGVFILLFTRRTARLEQRTPFAPPSHRPARVRLNYLHRLLPVRQALPMAAMDRTAELLEEDQDWQPLPPLQEEVSPPPLKPPRWLIDAGLLPGDTGTRLPANPQGVSGKGKAPVDRLNQEQKPLKEAEYELAERERSTIPVGWTLGSDDNPQS